MTRISHLSYRQRIVPPSLGYDMHFRVLYSRKCHSAENNHFSHIKWHNRCNPISNHLLLPPLLHKIFFSQSQHKTILSCAKFERDHLTDNILMRSAVILVSLLEQTFELFGNTPKLHSAQFSKLKMAKQHINQSEHAKLYALSHLLEFDVVYVGAKILMGASVLLQMHFVVQTINKFSYENPTK